jgi:tetratricopeptide (TPR) repeat protein
MKYLLLPITLIIHICLLLGNLFASSWTDGSSSFYNFADGIAFMSESGLASNNLGNIDYKKNEFTTAEKYYLQAISRLEEKNARMTAQYNLGNTYFREGQITLFNNITTFFPLKNALIITTDARTKTIALWQKSISSYEEALRLVPDDKQTQENLDFVKKQLEYLLDSKAEESTSTGNNGDNGDPKPEDGEPNPDDIKRIQDQDSKGQSNGKSWNNNGSGNYNYKGPTW